MPWTDERVVEAIADGDEAVLARWIDGRPRGRELRRALRRGIEQGTMTPLVCGSAITGVPHLCQVLTRLMPMGAQDSDGSPSGTVFAVDRDQQGRRV